MTRARGRIAELPGYDLALEGTFFQEFVIRCPKPPSEIDLRLEAAGIIGGLDVSDQIEDGMLLCVTEVNTREQIDGLVAALQGIG